jgi:hypothetical protein
MREPNMKHCCTLIAIGLFALVAACRDSREGAGLLTGPTPDVGGPGRGGSYTLTGIIRDLDGVPLPGATVLVSGWESDRSEVSDGSGFYRFDGLSGQVSLRVSKHGYFGTVRTYFIAANQVLDLWLDRVVILTVGTTVRGTVRGEPCDPSGWDAHALCQRIFVTPSMSGMLDLVLRWVGNHSLDLLMSNGLYVGDPTGAQEIRTIAHVAAHAQYEIRIHSYYDPAEFELSAEWRSAP